jgi:hypothetical protein
MTPVSEKDLLGQIRALDSELGPAGLYGSDRGLIFTKVLYPEFKDRGFRVASFSKAGQFAYFESPTDQSKRLEFVSVAKIKVRAFGDQYRVDPKVNHQDRWDQKKLQRLISRLWSARDSERLYQVLFVGFGAGEQPFQRELTALRDSLDWDRRGVSFDSRYWSDPHGRRFATHAAIWTAAGKG